MKKKEITVGFEDGAGHKPRHVVTSRSWKREGSGFLPEPSRRDQMCQHLDCGPLCPCQPHNEHMLFYTAKSVLVFMDAVGTLEIYCTSKLSLSDEISVKLFMSGFAFLNVV